MRQLLGRCLVGAFVAAVPEGAAAQDIARNFGELQTLLKPGEYVLVVDRAEREMWGRVVEVSGSILTIVRVTPSEGGARIDVTDDRRSFPAGEVKQIRRSDRPGGRAAVVYPATWDEVDRLPSMADVSIELASATPQRYRFARADADAIYAVAETGQEHVLKKSEIVRVERHGTSDGTMDGLLLGALIGGGAGLGSMAIAYANVCETCDAPAPGPMFLAAGAFCTGAGALTGWVIDKLHKGKKAVFPTVSPVVTARQKGVALAWRF